MKLGELLKTSEDRLKAAGIISARLDSLILIEDTFHKERSWVLAHPELNVNDAQARRLLRKVERRTNHVPIAYIRGFSEFYGRRFKVNRHVLEPRPESETMIELLKELRLRRPAIADIGTGNGAI